MLEIINRGDLCPLVGVILILVVLGRLLTSDRQKTTGIVLALICFLTYGIYALQEFPPKDAESLFSITLRALIVFGLVLGLSWVVIPLVGGGLSIAWKNLQQTSQAAGAEFQRIEQQWQAEDRRRQEAKAWEQAAPEREKAKQESDEKAKLAAQAKKRGEDARASCELLFQLHAHALGDRFPRAMFDDFMKRYLGDDHAPDTIENRAKQLQQVILQHVKSIDPPMPKHTIESLTTWYQQTKTLIESLAVEPRYKQTQLAHLNRRYVELMQKVLDESQP